ncbi:hypothetical protein X801_03075, partial [Opisthorchis viverrini]
MPEMDDQHKNREITSIRGEIVVTLLLFVHVTQELDVSKQRIDADFPLAPGRLYTYFFKDVLPDEEGSVRVRVHLYDQNNREFVCLETSVTLPTGVVSLLLTRRNIRSLANWSSQSNANSSKPSVRKPAVPCENAFDDNRGRFTLRSPTKYSILTGLNTLNVRETSSC